MLQHVVAVRADGSFSSKRVCAYVAACLGLCVCVGVRARACACACVCASSLPLCWGPLGFAQKGPLSDTSLKRKSKDQWRGSPYFSQANLGLVSPSFQTLG